MIKNIYDIDPKLLEADDRIEAYLRGEMTEEEERRFLQELESNPLLKEKAVAIAHLIKGMKAVGAEQDQAIRQAFLASSEHSAKHAAKKAIEDEWRAKHTNTEPVKAMTKEAPIVSRRTLVRWLSVAASLILIVWLGYGYFDYRHTTGLGDEYGNQIDRGTVVRGAESATDAEKKLEALFADVKSGENLESAIHELSLCWELSTMETYNDYTNNSADIGWHLAIAHLKDNDKKAARQVLDKLISISEDGSAMKEKAKELKEKI